VGDKKRKVRNKCLCEKIVALCVVFVCKDQSIEAKVFLDFVAASYVETKNYLVVNNEENI
jgi:hypothetical protein